MQLYMVCHQTAFRKLNSTVQDANERINVSVLVEISII